MQLFLYLRKFNLFIDFLIVEHKYRLVCRYTIISKTFPSCFKLRCCKRSFIKFVVRSALSMGVDIFSVEENYQYH